MVAAERDIPVISNRDALLRCGVVPLVPIASDEVDAAAWKKWAADLSVVTPAIMTAEGDGEYAFYRNILDESTFPFEAVLRSAVGEAIRNYFHVSSLDEIKLDDAFCIHYNMAQKDTKGAKHMDPSDITVNLCLEKSDDCEGSHVLFHGTQVLRGVAHDERDVAGTFQFLVNQQPGCATLHWGRHPHDTTALQRGTRTNVVLTYCYTDKSRSDVATRTCYM